MQRLLVILMLISAVAACGAKNATTTTTAGAPGTITGKVYIVGTPCETPTPDSGCDGPGAGYEVSVLAKDGKTIVAKATADASGVYTVEVPSGEYAIMIPSQHVSGRTEDKRKDVTVRSGETTMLDLTIDTGVRAAPAPGR